MKRLIIYLKPDPKAQPVQVELHGDKPIKELISQLINILNWPTTNDQRTQLYYWFVFNSAPINEEVNPVRAGISNGMVLFVDSGTKKPEFPNIGTYPPIPDVVIPKAQKSPFGYEPLTLELQKIIGAQSRREPVRPPSTWKKISKENYS